MEIFVQHIAKYIYILLTFLLFVGTPSLAATGIACKDRKQNNALNLRWKCPSLANTKLDATLSDLSIKTGHYTCEYRYKDTQQVATVCTYTNISYKTELDKELKAKRNEIVKIIKGQGTLSKLKTFYENLLGTDHLKELRNPKRFSLENKFYTEINDSLFLLKTYFNPGAVGASDYLYGGQPTNDTNITKALKDSYTNFVQPYTPNRPTSSKDDNRSTFSRFVTGLVTLDSEIVKGYNDNKGTLILNNKWSITSVGVINEIKKFFAKDNNESYTFNTDRSNISTWVDIFRQKIWGFYYNLQRRLDLGYDIISTQLLFIMMVFFSIIMAARGGARYITNRENGHSSGEIKINEAGIMKTLGILATVFTFYISVPSDMLSQPDTAYSINEEGDLNNKEMRTNSSLSKELIRYAMKEGATFGTMISDLGTDAFLRYIVHKQGLDNGLREGDNVIDSILSLFYYYPAQEIIGACEYQTGLSYDRILSEQGSVAISANFSKHLTAAKYKLYKDYEITMISDDLCRKLIYATSDTLYKISTDVNSLLAMAKNDKFLRKNATVSLVKNHIALQKELGWMNIASIPYTYFMMKNQHLFYESSIDYEDIESRASKYAETIGIRSGQDTIDSTLWIKDITTTKSRLKNSDKDGDTVKEFTRLAVYNFLPGFSSIRNEVLQRIQSLFSDILRMQRGKHGDAKDNLRTFETFLNQMTRVAAGYYGKINKLFIRSEMKTNLKKALGANGGRGDPVLLHTLFFQISYLVAMAIWKSGFILVFLTAIAMIIGLKIVLYVIHVMIHFFISPFIVIWAFVSSTDGGMGKIKNYLRDTLIYMLYPTIIVVGVFVFIFAYELFYSIYGFITAMLIEGQTSVVENMVLATVTKNHQLVPTDIKMGFLAVYALKDITEILIDLLSVYVAFLTINKFPELVLKMMGVSDSAVIMLPQASEAIQSKGGGSVSPLSR